MSSRLTLARRSVWDAIDNWPALENTFRRKYRFESTGSTGEATHRPDAPTCMADLPAIAIVPSAVFPQWATNLQKDHPYALDIFYWTPGRHVDKSEEIWDEIVKAIYQSKPTDNLPEDTYLKGGTGYSSPVGEGPSKMTFEKIGRDGGQQFDVTQHQFQLVLRMKINPRSTNL